MLELPWLNRPLLQPFLDIIIKYIFIHEVYLDKIPCIQCHATNYLNTSIGSSLFQQRQQLQFWLDLNSFTM